MLAGPRTVPVSAAIVLCCVGALLLITACGFIPPARPSPQPDTLILQEASGRLLGHGTLRMTDSVHARAALTLYGPGGKVSTVDLAGLLVLTLPRHLLLHGAGGQAKVSLSAVIPGPLSPANEGESGLLPLAGQLRIEGPAGTTQREVRASLYAEDHFLLSLPATGSNGRKTSFSLSLTLWPGDLPGTRHVAAELDAHPPCGDLARSDESASTPTDGPFALALKTAHGGAAYLQFDQPLSEVRARADVLTGSVTFRGRPCDGQRYTLNGASF